MHGRICLSVCIFYLYNYWSDMNYIGIQTIYAKLFHMNLILVHID
jgi:hypothetical protein